MPVTADEVQRRLAEVLERFETLANRLDTTYVRRDVFDAYKDLMSAKLEASKSEREALSTRMSIEHDGLGLRIKNLEDDKVAKNRLIWGSFVSAAVSIAVAIILAVVLHHGGG